MHDIIAAVVNPLVHMHYCQFVEYLDHELTADVYAHGLGGGIYDTF